MLQPVIKSTGPRDAKIMLIGEAPGQEEKMLGVPFVGPSGRELKRMLKDAGIAPESCYFTNVFHSHPPDNKLEAFCGPKSTALPGLPPVAKGRYIRNEFAPELARLNEEIKTVAPNILVALGNIALGALTGQGGIGKSRGTVGISRQGPKFLATYHPAAVLRTWLWRVIVVADLSKVARESHSPLFQIPQRQVLIDPTLAQLEFFYEQYIEPATEIAVDIETGRGQIKCIGFATSPTMAVVIPFIDPRQSGYNYWATAAEEAVAMRLVRRVLMDRTKIKVLQNGSYDLQYIWRCWGIPVYGFAADTTLAHHALYPEMQKDLGFLGSIYTMEPQWKLMRKRSGDDEKKEE